MLHGRVFAVPFVFDNHEDIFLKTICPSRKLQRLYGKKKTRIHLDAFERKVEESLGEYVPVSSYLKKQILETAAKTKTISLRINEALLEDLKRKAAEEGLPYQTLISSVLYKFSAGRLVDESALRRVVAALK